MTHADGPTGCGFRVTGPSSCSESSWVVSSLVGPSCCVSGDSGTIKSSLRMSQKHLAPTMHLALLEISESRPPSSDGDPFVDTVSTENEGNARHNVTGVLVRANALRTRSAAAECARVGV